MIPRGLVPLRGGGSDSRIARITAEVVLRVFAMTGKYFVIVGRFIRCYMGYVLTVGVMARCGRCERGSV